MAGEIELSTDALKQSYEWRIAQLSALGTAFLTATFGILVAIVTEAIKKEGYGGVDPEVARSAAAGSIAGLLVFGACRMAIGRLRREFLALYDVLLILKQP
jgi:hypothetical protein